MQLILTLASLATSCAFVRSTARRGLWMTSTSPRVETTSSVLRTVAGDRFALLTMAGGDKGMGADRVDGVRIIYSLSVGENKQIGSGDGALLSARLGHRTTGPVPRSAAPSILLLESPTSASSAQLDETAVFSLVEECLRWYLDAGGRIGKLVVAVPAEAEAVLKPLATMGFRQSSSPPGSLDTLAAFYPASSVLLTADGRSLLQFVESRAKAAKANKAPAAEQYLLHDTLGRLQHDLGDAKSSIDSYTSALTANPSAAAAFRNLGSAYHAVGNTQLAFASYQQAIQLDPQDALVYLKLAYFYEDFASKDWVDAAEHALKCYSYYLQNVDAEDTAVLTRLGNLQVREHRGEEAISSYSKALSIDASLANVWFNKAHAQVKVGDTDGALQSLRRTLELDESITAARHMIQALSPVDSQRVTVGDDKYVKELFDSYSGSYDPHVKKLLYSAPRVIRQELAKVYKGRFTMDAAEEEEVPLNLPSEQPGCTTIVPTIAINATLEVLDLGCGTGLAGAWLKDYAKLLVGVDLSEQMVTIARKKMLYQELDVMSIASYLQQCTRSFDLVVAADVLSYVGDLTETFALAAPVLRVGGHLVFTVEALEGNKDAAAGAENDPKGFTLLKSGRCVRLGPIPLAQSLSDRSYFFLPYTHTHAGSAILEPTSKT